MDISIIMTHTIQTALLSLQDLSYRDFQSKLMPTIDKSTVIGVRMPALRGLAKQIGIDTVFMSALPHTYYEENNLHALMIMQISNYSDAISAVNGFLPYVDNWATCDLLAPKVFEKNKDTLLFEINKWLESEHIYTVRFAIGMLMRHFLEKDFDIKYPKKIAGIQTNEYYVNMMIGWYFATALAKQYDAILPFFENHRLSRIPHNMAIRKAIESYRIQAQQKAYLSTLKR